MCEQQGGQRAAGDTGHHGPRRAVDKQADQRKHSGGGQHQATPPPP
ncbi:hypothetical protein [Polaromonas sp. UC242_47]